MITLTAIGRNDPALMTSADFIPDNPEALTDKLSLAPPWPLADEDVKAALERAYGSGDWGRYHGAECASLSDELQAHHGVEHASLCSSGTVAVELALRGLGVAAGDEVLLAAYDFPGNFRAIEAIGARPVLLDLGEVDAQLDVRQVETAVSPRTKAVIASHLHSGFVDMPALRTIADDTGLAIVEDACQCPGAWLSGKRAGTWGDIGVLSFGGSKLLTAGRGGALLCNDAGIMQRIKVFRERGNDAFPLSELQAAVLRPQLAKLDTYNAQRFQASRHLIARMEQVSTLQPLAEVTSNQDPTSSGHDLHQPGFYKLGMWFDPESAGKGRDAFSDAARAAGIALDPGFRGFAGRSGRRCRKVGELTNAQKAAEQLLILHHPVLLEPYETLDVLAATLQKLCDG